MGGWLEGDTASFCWTTLRVRLPSEGVPRIPWQHIINWLFALLMLEGAFEVYSSGLKTTFHQTVTLLPWLTFASVVDRRMQDIFQHRSLFGNARQLYSRYDQTSSNMMSLSAKTIYWNIRALNISALVDTILIVYLSARSQLSNEIHRLNLLQHRRSWHGMITAVSIQFSWPGEASGL